MSLLLMTIVTFFDEERTNVTKTNTNKLPTAKNSSEEQQYYVRKLSLHLQA